MIKNSPRLDRYESDYELLFVLPYGNAFLSRRADPHTGYTLIFGLKSLKSHSPHPISLRFEEQVTDLKAYTQVTSPSGILASSSYVLDHLIPFQAV